MMPRVHAPTTPSDPLARLSEIVRTERGALVVTARSEGVTAEEAIECVQDALCTFLASAGAGDHVLAALHVTVRNAARNFRRLHRRLKPHEPIGVGREPEGASPTPEELLANAEDVVRLRACVVELCGVERAVVMLRLLEERSGEDVAEALGISRGYVDVLLHRAKAALRVCMRVG
jgi:RNA polymerase sigma-70 factor (ECF subfamily)